MKRPSFQFYPADWRKDPELRVCSVAARGLWMDMLCIQHESETYGHLMVGGEPVSETQLARLVGESPRKVRRLLGELARHNVFSRNENGVIFSRRMIHDEHIRTVRAAGGKLGGNPALMGGNRITNKVKQKPTPSSSSSSSTSITSSSPRETLLSAAPNRGAWEGELRAMLEGMPGHVHATAAQLDVAIAEYVANSDFSRERPNLRLFKGYVKRASQPEREPRAVHGTVAERTFQRGIRALETEP